MHASSFAELLKGILGEQYRFPSPAEGTAPPGGGSELHQPLHQMAALSVTAKGTKMLPTGVKPAHEQGGCRGASHGAARPCWSPSPRAASRFLRVPLAVV